MLPRDLLETAVEEGGVPGAAALVARGDEVEVAAADEVRLDSIVRIASLTKPITAAAVMLLLDEGYITLDDPIARWLPELASPRVVRTPGSPVDDVVPAARPITVEDVLTSRAGWGIPSDFSLPAVVELFKKPAGVRAAGGAGRVAGDARRGADAPPAGRGVAVQHVLRHPRGADRARGGAAAAGVSDPSGAGGLVSTLADWHRFGRMLLADGGRLLSRESVRLLMTDHMTQAQRDASALFLEGAGWGFGGSVAAGGRYGWAGGTGTTAHVAPSARTIGILLTQVQMPGPMPLMRRSWQYAFGAAPNVATRCATGRLPRCATSQSSERHRASASGRTMRPVRRKR